VNLFAAGIRVEDHLSDAVAVAQIDEYQSPVIAIGMNPPGDLNDLADIR
jgi:hypothetical protein